MVSKLEEAKHIVAAVKYFPEGRRGVALPPLHRYAPQPMPEAVKFANRDLALFLQIENNEGVENAALAAQGACLGFGNKQVDGRGAGSKNPVPSRSKIRERGHEQRG